MEMFEKASVIVDFEGGRREGGDLAARITWLTSLIKSTVETARDAESSS